MKPRPMELVSVPPSPTVAGNVTVTLSGSPPSLSLSGNGAGWSASGSTLTLEPLEEQTLTVWYQLTFSCPSGFTLFGVQIFREDGHSAILLLASEGNLVLNFLNHIESNQVGAQYTLVVGVKEGSNPPLWFDPTIAFEPDQGETFPVEG